MTLGSPDRWCSAAFSGSNRHSLTLGRKRPVVTEVACRKTPLHPGSETRLIALAVFLINNRIPRVRPSMRMPKASTVLRVTSITELPLFPENGRNWMRSLANDVSIF